MDLFYYYRLIRAECLLYLSEYINAPRMRAKRQLQQSLNGETLGQMIADQEISTWIVSEYDESPQVVAAAHLLRTLSYFFGLRLVRFSPDYYSRVTPRQLRAEEKDQLVWQLKEAVRAFCAYLPHERRALLDEFAKRVRARWLEGGANERYKPYAGRGRDPKHTSLRALKQSGQLKSHAKGAAGQLRNEGRLNPTRIEVARRLCRTVYQSSDYSFEPETLARELKTAFWE